jgi:hypothetical protein
MAVQEVQAFSFGGQLYGTKAEAERAEAKAELLRLCRHHFNGGEYSDDMIAGVLEDDATRFLAILKRLAA